MFTPKTFRALWKNSTTFAILIIPRAKLISQSSCTSNSVTVDPEISSDQFEQVAMEWFQAICPKVKESTSNKYRNLLSSYILPVFGSKQLRDITHEFIETQCNFSLFLVD